MKLPEGWRVWLLVIGLNVLAGYLWFIDRGGCRQPLAATSST